MSKIDDDLLQRYYDGELSAVEERSVQARVEADPDAQSRLQQLGRLSDAIKRTAQDLGREVDADALFAGISEGITKQSSGGGPGTVTVITNEWLQHRRGPWLPLSVAGVIAAAAMLAVLGKPDEAVAPGPVAEQQPEAPASTGSTGALEAPAEPGMDEEPEITIMAAQGSHVEAVDFGHNAGTVFEIHSRGVSTAVVWIAEDTEEGQAP